jgi:kinesin family protein 4/21/27
LKKITFLLYFSKYRLAEQRRHRVQELEKNMADLRKKIENQNQLLKTKERNEEKMKRLDSEIQVFETKLLLKALM